MIRQNMLRYTVPFHTSDGNNLIYSSLKNMGWEQKHIVQGENDLYDYIVNLMNERPENDVASSWQLPKDFYIKKRFVTRLEQQDIVWNINQMGLVLFTTGVGILWYEIDISKLNQFEQIMDISYTLKELTRGERENNYIQFSELVKSEKNIKIEKLKNDESVIIDKVLDTKQGAVVKGIKKINFFSDILQKFIPNIQIDSYFANRMHEGEIRPDRAIPFSWVYECSENHNEDVQEYDKVFHLGRAYKSSYDMSSKVDKYDFYEPFNDSVWYASLEGCANYVYPTIGKSFYDGGYRGRLDMYFYLYILCLGQYYSLLQLAQEVSTLPTEKLQFMLDDNQLESLLDKIHIFNLKNNYSQVGHFTQHNEFYEYVQRKLGINKMQQELEVELQTLFEMIERKKMILQERKYKVLSIIGGIFVVLQAFINVAAMYASAQAGDWGYFVFATVGCIILAAIGVFMWILWWNRSKKK